MHSTQWLNQRSARAISSALQKGFKQGDFTIYRRTVAPRRGGQQGDLQIHNINLAGKANLVIDVVHDFFSGECWRSVRQNGQLPSDDVDPDMLLNNAANAKVRKYREA